MDKLFLELLNLSIAASWLILVVLLLRPLLKKTPRAIVCTLWLLVGLRLALPFSIESVLSLIPSRETVSPEIVYAAQPMIDSGVKIVDQVVNPVIVENFAPSPVQSVNPLQVLNFIGGCAWLMGLVLMLGYGTVSYIRLRLKVRESVLVEKGVRQGRCVASPFVLGFFRPCIYLPGSLAAEDRPMVLAHERAHIRRGDHWAKALGFLLLAVYWFNPLVWLSYVLLCRDIELACDEKVLKELGQGAKKRYSMALLNCSYSHRAVAACPLAFGEVGVKTRIQSVLNYKKPAFWVTATALVICLVVALCFLTDPVAEPAPGPESPAPSPAAQTQPEQANVSTVPEVSLSSEQETAFVAAQAALDELYERGLLSMRHNLDPKQVSSFGISATDETTTSVNGRVLPAYYYVNCGTKEGNWATLYVSIDSGKAFSCHVSIHAQEGDPQLDKEPANVNGRDMHYYDNFARVMREDMTLEEYCALLNDYWGFDGCTISGTKYAPYGYDTQPPAGNTRMRDLVDQPFVTLYFAGDQENMPTFLEGHFYPGNTYFSFGFYHAVG
ncbi:MAG: hypothetical protein J6J19_01160 [Oscillospiraceae bacterium]|nr:hypothetical protein [Oscillospiraceae bacterium]